MISCLDIRQVDEHYEVYIDGKFSFSADTMEEVIRELREEEQDAGTHD